MAFAQDTILPSETFQMSPVPRPQLFPNLEPTGPTLQTNNSCVIGSSSLRTYADQMDKVSLTEQDSFLANYKKQQDANIIPNYFRNDFKSYINKSQVHCAMKRIPMVSQNKKSCSKSSEAGTFVKQTPCVTDQMVDYIYWGLNEAMRCYDDALDSHERKMIFKKINHESAFGFFFQYVGGTGIAQLIGGSQRDLFSPGYAGNNFLTRHVRNNSKNCESFLPLLARKPKFFGGKNSKAANSCEFMSVGDGIGRSLIGGISLYLHYRSDPENPFSAEKLLKYWGYKKSNSERYKQVRSYITLGMYNKGPGAVLNTIKKSIGAGSLANKSDEESFNIIMRLIKNRSFYGYIKAVENSTNKIFDRSGSCKI